MPASPTARTLAYCRKTGIMAGVVERWNQYSMKHRDLFGFIDLIAIDHDLGALAIQASSTPNLSTRYHKSTEQCVKELTAWLNSGCRFELWGWAKRGKAGKRKLWTLKRIQVTLEPDGSFSQHEVQV